MSTEAIETPVEPQIVEEPQALIPFTRVVLRDVQKLEKGTVTTTALVESAEVKETQKGGAYVNYVLRDRTGKVNAKHWDTNQAIDAGEIVKIRAEVGIYRNQVQLKVDRIRVYHEEANTLDYVPATQFDVDQLKIDFWDVVDGMRGPHASFVHMFLRDHEETVAKMMCAPAALSYHHAFWHGLLEHTVSMCGLAKTIVAHYRMVYDDPIDEHLVVCGVILHDFAKALDQEWNGAEWVETNHAKLVGHIPMCIGMLQSFYDRFYTYDKPLYGDVLRDLQHLVAAHHGQIEFGSPIVPKTVEAMILHHVDLIDSKMAMWREATNGLESGEWSQWSRPLRAEFRK